MDPMERAMKFDVIVTIIGGVALVAGTVLNFAGVIH
jgi:hypothetical protein